LDPEKQEHHHDTNHGRNLSPSNAVGGGIWSTNPRLEQVGSVRQGEPPTILLKYAHNIAILTGLIGFIFAMAGIMCYVGSAKSIRLHLLECDFGRLYPGEFDRRQSTQASRKHYL
jgi:hypothetical protein